MSGPPQHNPHGYPPGGGPPRGWRGAPPSPVFFRPPSPWTSAHSPPIVSPVPFRPQSPLFGNPASRGVRGGFVPYRPGTPPLPGYALPITPPPGYYRPLSPVAFAGPPPPHRPVPEYGSPIPRPGSHAGHQSPAEYLYRPGPGPEFLFSPGPQPQYVGVPLEPPPPKPTRYVIYDDEDDDGPSTADIIASQSQDYVDEKLAEYQATILQLQG